MNFVKSTGLDQLSSNNVSWSSNPIYKSPESAGISWYDQINHWDPHSEGIFSIAQNSTDNPIPHWASRDQDLQGVRNVWDKTERQIAQNSVSSAQITPTPQTNTQSPNVPITPLDTPETRALGKTDSSRTAQKVASGVATAGGIAASAAALTGPVGIAAAINAAAGGATAGAIDASNKASISSDYVANSKVRGSQSIHQANLIKEMDTAHAGITASGAQIGGLFGPLGAIFGAKLADAFQDSKPSNLYDSLKTGYSFEGRFNPQDTGSANSATTANLSGHTDMTSSFQ